MMKNRKKCLSTGKDSFKKGDWKAIDERLVNHDQIGSFMWFLTFLCSTLPGELVQFDEYFSDGLKPPFLVIHCGESDGLRNQKGLTQHTETKFAWGRVVGVLYLVYSLSMFVIVCGYMCIYIYT